MNICFITTSPRLAGAENMLFELACALKDEHQVTVITIKSENNGPLLENLRAQGINTHSLNLDEKWKIWNAFKLNQLLKEINPDILQSFLFFDNLLARIFGKTAGVPIILSGQRNAEQISTPRLVLDRLTNKLAHATVSNTRAGKQILINHHALNEDTVHVIPNAARMIVADRSDELRAPSKTQIGFVGHLTKQKGVDILLKALPLIKSDLQNVIFTIIGDGPELEPLKQQAANNKAIRFLGGKSKADELMPAFDALILPSRWEGMPNVIMEAMMHGLPVIATRVGGIPELVLENTTGLLCEPDHPALLAQTIDRFLSLSKEEREQMGAHGKERAEKEFSIESMKGQFEELYARLLKDL